MTLAGLFKLMQPWFALRRALGYDVNSTGAQLATEKPEHDAAQATDVQSQSADEVGESTVLQEEPSSSQDAEVCCEIKAEV